MPLPTPTVLLLALCLAAAPGRAAAAPAASEPPAADPLQAQLEHAEQYGRFYERIRDTLTAPQWLPEGERFIYWSAVGPHAGTWLQVDARRHSAEPLIAPDALQAELSRLAGKKVQLPRAFASALTPDGQRLVFSPGEGTYALGLTDGRIVALPPTHPEALALSGEHQVSADRRAVASPRGEGFAVTDAAGRTLLERKGEARYAWQVPQRAWSPHSRFLALFRNDARRVHTLPVVDYTSALERTEQVPYAKSGTPLPRPELYLAEPSRRALTRVALPTEDAYAWLAGWRPDGSEALVLLLSRDGKRLELWAASPTTGKARRVLREERPESYVGALDFADEGWATQVVPLADNARFLWMSERDGWRHVYLYDWAGGLVRQVTRGAFPVHEVVGVAPKGDTLVVLASAEAGAPYDRIPYRASLAGGALTRLSPEPGMHRAWLSPSGAYFTEGHSTRSRPRAWDVRSVDGQDAWRYAEADVRELAPLGYTPPEGFTALAADGKTTLYGVLYKPRDFDPRKRYAVIDVIYAGPFTSTVPWNFVGNPESMAAGALAQLGFVTVVLDARGTPGRGKAFQDVNYGRVGQTEIPDHVAALRQVAASRPFMDLSRAGIYGHSWGGYFALRGMLTAPDFFKAGYAGAPGALEEEAIVNEPHLGLPGKNPEAYAAGSNLAVAKNLRGALKLMHGTSDVSASLSTTMRMSEALIRENKRFELLLMPGQAHTPRGPAGRYYRDDVRRFFVEKLGPPREVATADGRGR